MSKKIDLQAAMKLAIYAAVTQLDYERNENRTTFSDFQEYDLWDEVSRLVNSNIDWIGIDCAIDIDKYVIAESFWGIEKDDEAWDHNDLEHDDAEFDFV